MLASFECLVANIPLLSLTCTAQRDRIRVKHNENEKSLTSCLKAASYIKVSTPTALRAGSEAACKPSTSAGSEGECNPRTNTYVFSTAAVSILQTG